MRLKKIVSLFLISTMFINSAASVFAMPAEEIVVEEADIIISDTVEEISPDYSGEDEVVVSDNETTLEIPANVELVEDYLDLSNLSDYSDLCGYEAMPEEDVVSVVDEDLIGGSSEFVGAARSLPAKFLPDAPTMMPTRNQSPYNNCWAHSAISMAEQSMIKKNLADKSADYSELQLAYFTYNTATDPIGGIVGDRNYLANNYNFSARGGNLMFAEQVLAGWTGVVDESVLPYSKYPDAVANGLDTSYSFSKNIAHIKNAYDISLSMNQALVKECVQDRGAVGVSYCDESAYFTASTNAYYCNVKKSTNHAVAIVGWDDNFDKTNFKIQPDNNGAWLIRNSWNAGKSFDENDLSHNTYFWLSYEDKTLGATAYSFEFDDASKYDNNYQYDGGFYSGAVGVYDTVENKKYAIYMANVFDASVTEKEILKAVSFCTKNANLEYQIEIWKNPTLVNDNPRTGELISAATTMGETTCDGLYTVELASPVELDLGDRFSVVIRLRKLSDNDDLYNMVYEKKLDASTTVFRSDVYSKPGQGFWSYAWKAAGSSGINSATWYDFNNSSNTRGNLRIKAFTENEAYKISFDGNGADSGNTAALIVDMDGSATIPQCGYIKENFAFTGWNTKADGSGKTYLPGAQSEKLDGINNYTLYAQWEKVSSIVKDSLTLGTKVPYTATVTFDFDGGKETPQPYEIKGAKAKLIKPQKEGYTFKAWVLNNGKKISTISDKLLAGGNFTVKAVYVENKYSVKFAVAKPAGAKIIGKPKAMKATYEEEITIPENVTAVDKLGKTYKVVSWIGSDGKTYKPGDKVSQLAGKTKADKKFTLAAKWG